MHHMAAMPCMKSGMAMMTASMFFSSLSSILRKSVYLGALGYLVNICEADAESGSVMATKFWLTQPLMSSAARPPAPMVAMFNFSLGDLYPICFNEGVLPKPPAGTAGCQHPNPGVHRFLKKSWLHVFNQFDTPTAMLPIPPLLL